MSASKKAIREAAFEIYGWLIQRAVARQQGQLPPDPTLTWERFKGGGRNQTRAEMERRFPHFTPSDYRQVVHVLQELVTTKRH
jgi:hypothetical protein